MGFTRWTKQALVFMLGLNKSDFITPSGKEGGGVNGDGRGLHTCSAIIATSQTDPTVGNGE